jgi:glutamate dehydrogenase/leucine dehydrogenase
VTLIKFETVDAFVTVDFDDAPTSVGVVRLAPKILREGAELLARSNSYAGAFFGLRVGGASAGINSAPDGRGAAIEAFIAEAGPLVAERHLVLHPGLGIGDGELGAAGAPPADHTLRAKGAVAAAGATLGALSGVTVAFAGEGDLVDAARDEATSHGAEVVDGGIDAAADAVFVSGRSGVVDHDAAATVHARAVVPLTPLPVTAKAYAVLSRAGTTYVPDFVALAAPMLDEFDRANPADPVSRVQDAAAEIAADGVDAWRTAVDRAETFLRTWQPAPPFGRPLA